MIKRTFFLLVLLVISLLVLYKSHFSVNKAKAEEGDIKLEEIIYFRQGGNKLNNDGILGTINPKNLTFITSNKSRIIINNQGLVGINLATPSSQLHVNGDVLVAPQNGFAFNHPSGANDLYLTGNLEADGTIYGNINPGFPYNRVVVTGMSGELSTDVYLFWDSYTKSLAVGATYVSSQAKLDVAGPIRTQPTGRPGQAKGMIYFDSSDNHFYGFNGSAWVRLDN